MPTYLIRRDKQKKLTQYFNHKGQSLIEYLIVVALVAVASIGMIKAVGTNITVHFANISKALAGDESNEIAPVKVQSDQVKTRDLRDFMKGASNNAKR